MTSEERKSFREEIRFDVKEAIHEELGAYKVPKEQHYLDHVWLNEWRDWQLTIRNSVVKSIIGMMITAIGALIFYGFIFLRSSKGN